MQHKMAPKSERRRLAPWVGPWLRERREAAQKDDMDVVAARLKRSKSAVSRIETGDAVISADDLPLILRAYRVTPEDFAVEARRAGKAAA